MIHTKFVDNVLDFPKIQKGGAAPSGHPGILGPTSKKWKIFVFPLYRYENERGGKRGGTKKGGKRGGQPFRMLVPTKYTIIWDSDESFRGHFCIFWHNHYGISNIAICPPFAPPFLKFLFLKKVELHILPESKINLIRRLVPKIRYFKVKNVVI